MKLPSWWDANRPHWLGRTLAIVTLAAAGLAASIAVLVATVFTGEPSGTTSHSLTSEPLNSAPPTEASALCSSDSEGEPLTGWGPDRPVYTDSVYPTSLTFNSTYNNINYGDERGWIAAKSFNNKEPGEWQKTIEVALETEYLIRAYVHLDGPPDQKAEGARMMFTIPTCSGHRVGITGFITAENVYPQTIWSGIEFWSRDNFALQVIPDTAELRNNQNPGEGIPLSTSALPTSTGVPLAPDQLNGLLAPGYDETLIVTFRVLAVST